MLAKDGDGERGPRWGKVLAGMYGLKSVWLSRRRVEQLALLSGWLRVHFPSRGFEVAEVDWVFSTRVECNTHLVKDAPRLTTCNS